MFNSKACVDSERSMEDDEPTFQYIPVDASPASRNKSQSDKLHQSIMLLYEGLESEAFIDQFEKLYLKRPEEKMLVAKMSVNLNKNRYRDISPCTCTLFWMKCLTNFVVLINIPCFNQSLSDDSTRVILNENPNGDYINASFVNVSIDLISFFC